MSKSVLTPIDTKGAKVKKKRLTLFFNFIFFRTLVTLTKKEKSTFFYGTKPASHPLVTLIRAYQKVSIVDRKGGTYVRYYVHNIGLDNVTHTKELKRRETSTKRKSTYSPQKSTTFTKDKGNVHLKRAVPFLGQKNLFLATLLFHLHRIFKVVNLAFMFCDFILFTTVLPVIDLLFSFRYDCIHII